MGGARRIVVGVRSAPGRYPVGGGRTADNRIISLRDGGIPDLADAAWAKRMSPHPAAVVVVPDRAPPRGSLSLA